MYRLEELCYRSHCNAFIRDKFAILVVLFQQYSIPGDEVDCKNICAMLMQKLNDPMTADAISPDVLDQLSNLIMVEQTLTGCLFALKGRSDVRSFKIYSYDVSTAFF